MKNFLIVAGGFALATVLPGLPSTWTGGGSVGLASLTGSRVMAAQAKGESITQTTSPNQPIRYAFGATDGYTDALVQLTLGGECEVKMTRIPVSPSEIINRCRDTSLANSRSILEMPNPNGGSGRPQRSIYRLEVVGNCPETAFPAHIDILYFGVAERVGATQAFRTRMVHDPLAAGGGDCTDVTTEVTLPKDPTNPDPRVGGGEGNFSDFFLVGLRDAALPDQNRITARVNALQSLTNQFLPSQTATLSQAQQAFDRGVSQVAQGNLSAAREAFQQAIQLFGEFVAAVEKARSQNQIQPAKASQLQVRAPRIVFAIKQFAALKQIEL